VLAAAGKEEPFLIEKDGILFRHETVKSVSEHESKVCDRRPCKPCPGGEMLLPPFSWNLRCLSVEQS
jgi:hypothetical protein